MAEYQRCPCGFPKNVCWRCTPVVDFPEKVALKGAPSASDTSPKRSESAVNTQSWLSSADSNSGDRAATSPWLASLSPRAREHYEQDASDDEIEPSAGPVPPLWSMLAVAGAGWLIGFLAGWLMM